MNLSPVLIRPIEFIEAIVTNVNVQTEEGGTIPLISRDEFGALKALSGYVKRDGFFGAIATVLHRIWNAIKAIFGQSDWQVAEKTINTLIGRILVPNAIRWAIPADVLHALDPNNPEQPKLLNELMESSVENLSEVNEFLKQGPVESLVLPIIEQFLNIFDANVIGQKLFDLPNIFYRFLAFMAQEENKDLSDMGATHLFVGMLEDEGIIQAGIGLDEIDNIAGAFKRMLPQSSKKSGDTKQVKEVGDSDDDIPDDDIPIDVDDDIWT